MFTPTNTVPLTSTTRVVVNQFDTGLLIIDVSFMELELSPSRRIWLKRLMDDELLPLLSFAVATECKRYGACGGTDVVAVHTFQNENGGLGAMATITVKLNTRVSYNAIRRVTDTGTFARRLSEVIDLFMQPLADGQLQKALAVNRYIVHQPVPEQEAYSLLPNSWSNDYFVVRVLQFLGSLFARRR